MQRQRRRRMRQVWQTTCEKLPRPDSQHPSDGFSHSQGDDWWNGCYDNSWRKTISTIHKTPRAITTCPITYSASDGSAAANTASNTRPNWHHNEHQSGTGNRAIWQLLEEMKVAGKQLIEQAYTTTEIYSRSERPCPGVNCFGV